VDGILGIEEAGVNLHAVDEKLANLGVPSVWINRDPEPGILTVISDEYNNGWTLARHLIDLGHRRIGYVGYNIAAHYTQRERYQGIKAALEQAGWDTSLMVVRKDQTPMIEFVRRYVAEYRDISALICISNACYNAALHQAAAMGIKVPGDLVLGHFGSTQGSPQAFPMPVLEVPKVQMARTAVQILLDLLDGKPAPDAIPPIPGKLHIPHLPEVNP
jgi:LacI family transcriptional regulator